MTDDFYKKAFETALSELSDLESNREELNKKLDTTDERIEKVRQAALGLLSLAGIDFQEIKDKYPTLFRNDIDPRLGITNAVRQVLKTSSDMLTTHQIRDLVFQVAPAIAAHKNPIATVSAILRRLIDYEEVISGVFEDGKTVYGWVDDNDAEERIKRWFGPGGEEAWEDFSRRAKAKKE